MNNSIIDAILQMKTNEDFANLSVKLMSSDSRVSLSSELVERYGVMHLEDMWTRDVIFRVAGEKDLMAALEFECVNDTEEQRIIHLLQIFGYMNPGLRVSINKLLLRTLL